MRVFLAGGVPEAMLHLRRLGLLDTAVLTVTGLTLGENLDAWETSERRAHFRRRLQELDGVEPDDVIMSPEQARARGLTGTLIFPTGNLAPEGSVVKATAIDPRALGAGWRLSVCAGPARVFTSERAAIPRSKRGGSRPVTSWCWPASARWARAWRRPTR